MGQGRNAIYLEQQGWDVTDFDPAVFAILDAIENASNLGVKVNTVVAGAEDFDWGEDRWDLILFSCADIDQNGERARRSLRSGGVVVVEGSTGRTATTTWFSTTTNSSSFSTASTSCTRRGGRHRLRRRTQRGDPDACSVAAVGESLRLAEPTAPAAGVQSTQDRKSDRHSLSRRTRKALRSGLQRPTRAFSASAG